MRRHPTRFAGLASFAPQDPPAAAKEMERAIRTLKLNGFLVNSHTQNGYLDEQRFWPSRSRTATRSGFSASARESANTLVLPEHPNPA